MRAFRRLPAVLPTSNVTVPVSDAAIAQREDTVLATVQRELNAHQGLPFRPDGWAYAIDLGNLMVYGAERGDLALFRSLSGQVEQHYLISKSDDPNALYTVAWRYQPGQPDEASGTTETLRMVEAYWTAGERWNNDYYRRLAYLMAKAYAHHQTSDQYGENWFIRNYYNYGTQGYATNSFLVDYAPDVLRYVADYSHDADLRAVADQSAKFLLAGQTPIGLFEEMYQPELSTLYKNLLYFSPNGIMQLIDSEEAALGLSKLYAPDRARLTYDFAKGQYISSGGGPVSNQFYVDGSPLPKGGGAEGGPALYAYIARLGARLGDPRFAERLIVEQLDPTNMYVNGAPDTDGNWYFAWSSALLAMREYQEALSPSAPATGGGIAGPAAPAPSVPPIISATPGPGVPVPEATTGAPAVEPSAAPETSATPEASATPVPTPAGDTMETASPDVAASGPQVQAFTVREGDSLSYLADWYGVSVASLADANGLAANAGLEIGQVLVIPARPVPATMPAP